MPYVSDVLIQLPPETSAAFQIRVLTYITDQYYYFVNAGGSLPVPASGAGGPSTWIGYPPIEPTVDTTVWDPVGLQFVRTVTFNYNNDYYYKFLGIAPPLPPPSPLPAAGDLAMFGPSGTVVDTGFFVDTVAGTVDWNGSRHINAADGIGAQDLVTMTQLAAAVAGSVISVNGVLPVLGNVSLTSDDIPVGVTNFYTTNPITLAYVLTGFVAGGAGPITAADTILSAFESLQFQVSAATNSLTSTYIGFGSGANLLTGTANLTWNDASRILNVVGTIGLVLDNAANVFYVAQGNVGYWYTGSASTGLLSHQGFGIDFKTNEIYTMGAVGLANNNYIEVNDTASTVKISTLAGAGGTVVASAAGLLSTIPTTAGTVTSVGLLLPAEFTITVSPITTAGALTATWTAVAPFLVLAGPSTAVPPAAPTFRSLVNDDLPVISIAKGGTNNSAYTTGSVIFYDGTKLGQDNANFFWDDTNNRLGLGTATPADTLHVLGLSRFESVAGVFTRITGATVNTTDATQTTLQTIAIATDTVILIQAYVTSRKTAGAGVGTVGDGNGYIRTVKAKNVGGTVTIGTTQSSFTSEDIASFNVTFDVSGTNVRVRVDGSANNNVTWDTTTLLSQ